MPEDVPREGEALVSIPVAALHCGSRLSSKAAILSASNFGCCFWGGRFGGSGCSSIVCFGSSCCLILSAIGSDFGGGGSGGGGVFLAPCPRFFFVVFAFGFLIRFGLLLGFFLDEGFWRFDLGRVLHTPGHLREVFFAH